MNKYYTYAGYYRGILIYIGKGTSDRVHHLVNGQSGSELINDFYFRVKYLNDIGIVPKLISTYRTSEAAANAERKLISKYQPYCNKCAGRQSLSEYDFMGKLATKASQSSFGVPERLDSKFDFRFLFTPKGLLCKKVTLSEDSPFEHTGEDWHIRLKKDLLIHFPEYSFQFMLRSSLIEELIGGAVNLTEVLSKVLELGDNVFSHVTTDKCWINSALHSGNYRDFEIAEVNPANVTKYYAEKRI